MSTAKTDRRVRRTERMLEDALLDLLQKKSVYRISVRELAEAADITRATFYTHYRDAADMLARIQERMVGCIICFIRETDGRDPAAFFNRLFRYLAEEVHHPELLFYDVGDGSAFERVGNAIREQSMLCWTRFPDAAKEDYEYYRSYLIFGCVAVIRRWIDSGMAEDPAHMTAVALRMLPGQ